MLENNVLHI